MPVALWAGVIFAFSTLPGSSIPGHYTVLGHFGEYAVLGALAAFAVGEGRLTPRTALTILAVCALYAWSDEFHQAFVPGRTPDTADWAMDAIGTAVGISAIVVARYIGDRRGPAGRPRAEAPRL